MDHTARTLSYAVSGMSGNYALSGLASFDGCSFTTAGDTNVFIYFPPPTNLVAVAGDRAVYLLWPRVQGATGYNVHCWPAGSAGSIEVRDAGLPANYFGVTSLTNNTVYYFTVAAYDAQGHEGELSALASAIPCSGCGALGNVRFDRAYYNGTNLAVVAVQDANLNSDPNTVQTVSVRLTSDSDSWGITLTLTESGTNSDLFTSAATGTNLGFTFGNSDDTNKLIHVLATDRIHVTYADIQVVAGLARGATPVWSGPRHWGQFSSGLVEAPAAWAARAAARAKPSQNGAPSHFTVLLTKSFVMDVKLTSVCVLSSS